MGISLALNSCLKRASLKWLDAKIKFMYHSSEKFGGESTNLPIALRLQTQSLSWQWPYMIYTLNHSQRMIPILPSTPGTWLPCDSSDICSHICLRAFALLYPLLCAPSPPGYLHGSLPLHVLFFFQVSHSQWAFPNYITLNLCSSLFCSIFPPNAHHYLMSTYTSYLLSTSLD